MVYKSDDVNTAVTVNGNSFIMPDYDVTVSAVFLTPQGGDVTVGSGTSTNGGNYLPTTDYYKFSLTQQIYTQSELGEAGSITAISFYYSTSTASNPRSLAIYMTHTSNSTISSWQTQSSSNLVYSGTYTFEQGWNTITLTTPFAYDGTSNLLLTVDDNTNSWTTNSYFYTYSTNANRAIAYKNDNTNPDPTGSVSVTASQYKYNAQMIVTKVLPCTEGYLSVATGALSGFTYAQGEGPSDAQSLAVIGTNLQDNLTVTPPTGFEVSSDGNSFSTTITLTPTSGDLQKMLYIRLKANLTQGSYSGSMTLVSGSTTQNVSLSGEVTSSSNPTTVQTTTLSPGWNLWTPNVNLSGAELLAQLKQAIGNNGIKILAQNNKFLSYNASTSTWSGNITTLEIGVMYKISMSNSCDITLSGPSVDFDSQSVTIYPGNNWIGFFGPEPVSLNTALSNYSAVQGDKIILGNKFATFNGTSWTGNLLQLVPGNGYIYKSNASNSQTLYYNSGK